MQKRHRHALFPVAIALLLLFGSVAAPHAHAQSGYNNVTFWDDAGENDDTAFVQSPGARDYTKYLNPNGGRTATDGLLVGIGNVSGDMIVRDRDWQVYSNEEDRLFFKSGTLQWILTADGGCFSEDDDCTYNTDPSLGTVLTDSPDFDSSTVTLTQSGPTVWKAQKVLVKNWNGRVYTLTVNYTYTPPSEFVYLEASLAVTPNAPAGKMHLYIGADMYLDGIDVGPGTIDFYKGKRVVMQYNESSAGGIGEGDKRPFDSYFQGYYTCLYSDYSLVDCGNTAAHWNVDENSPDHWFGPGFAEGYPMPAIVNGTSEGYDINTDIDAGVGAHWNVTTNRKVDLYYVFTTRDTLLANLSTTPPDEEEEGAVPTPAPTVCEQTPAVAVTPQLINLAPGARATVTVTMRNLCNDAPLRSSDLLLSLSDGLRVIGGSDGLVNLGQRAAMQGLTLSPDETRSWTFEVEAAATLPVAALFVVELYQGSNVTQRIDGVFITPAPAPAPLVEAPAPAAAPATPAPLPVALPNTGGMLPLLWLPALAAGAGAAGLALRRFTRR